MHKNPFASGGTLSAVNIISFPTNVTSIAVGPTTYYPNAGALPAICPTTTCLAFPASGGVVVPTDASGIPTLPIAIDPVDGNVTPVIAYSVTDNAGKTSAATANVNVPISVISVSGVLWNDANGDSSPSGEPNVSGTNASVGGSVPAGTSLFVTLVDPQGKVIQSIPLNADGTYNLTNVPANTTGMQILVSTTQSVVGDTPLPVTLPAGWVSTGNSVGAGNSATQASGAGTIINLDAGSATITNQSFGIERIPETDAKVTAINTPMANSFLTLDGLAGNPPFFSGSDGEDMPISGSLSAKTVAITSLPAFGSLIYNGNVIQFGEDGINPPSITNPFVIPNFNLSLMQVQFTGLGYTELEFNYAYIDAAGVMDATPATYNINWPTPLPIIIHEFNGKVKACEANLSWKITLEPTVTGFDVMRSDDGRIFTVAASVSVAENNSDYAATVPHFKTAFYQLKVKNIDGGVQFSEVVKLVGGCDQKGINLIPNPTNSVLTVIGTDADELVRVIDAVGKQVIAETALINHTLDVSRLIPGTYILQVKRTNGSTVNLKFIKQ